LGRASFQGDPATRACPALTGWRARNRLIATSFKVAIALSTPARPRPLRVIVMDSSEWVYGIGVISPFHLAYVSGGRPSADVQGEGPAGVGSVAHSTVQTGTKSRLPFGPARRDGEVSQPTSTPLKIARGPGRTQHRPSSSACVSATGHLGVAGRVSSHPPVDAVAGRRPLHPDICGP